MLVLRLFRIFQRYAEETAVLTGTGFGLRDAGGRPAGRIDRVCLRGNRVEVYGRLDGSGRRVGLRLARAEAWSAPRPNIDPDKAETALLVDIPHAGGALHILLEDATGAMTPIERPIWPEWRIGLARAGRIFPFAQALVRLAPVIWRWKRQGDLGAREIVKEALSLVPRSGALPFDPAVLSGPTEAGPSPFARVEIVMPVFNAPSVTREAMERVAKHSRLDWHLTVIDDASTEPEVAPMLDAFASSHPGRVTILTNAENLGFVGSANRGLEAARTRGMGTPVVLLNSDAMVAEGWDIRLVAPLADPDVASITPMSNAAEILSVPVICLDDALAPGDVDALDRAAAVLNAEATVGIGVPTGVGFCMAMAPAFLDRLPTFDPVFGRGYGEEVDWCRKAMNLGGRHVAAVNVFVEHRGAQSFGSTEKQALLQRNSAQISRRYPDFDRDVQTFVRNDPLASGRLALGLTRVALASPEPVSCYLGHAMGGGAETDLARRVAADVGTRGAAVVLRVGQGLRWRIELHLPGGLTQGLTDDVAVVRSLLARLPKRRIVYSCGVGDRDAAALPGYLLDLAGRGEAPLPGGPHPIEVLLHDHFPISPSYTLLGSDGRWHGVPRPGTPSGLDSVHLYVPVAGAVVDLAAWQDRWGRLLSAADRIVAFSGSSRDLLVACYPETAATTEVLPHRLPNPVPRIGGPPGGDMPGTIGVLGNIGFHKGAAVLSDLSRHMARDRKGRVVVLGRLDPDFGLHRPSQVHGPFRMPDLPGLVARYEIGAWFIPSIWPETFSFACHEALETGLPVYAFDIGAQGDAVRSAPNGTALPLELARDPRGLLARLLTAPRGQK